MAYGPSIESPGVSRGFCVIGEKSCRFLLCGTAVAVLNDGEASMPFHDQSNSEPPAASDVFKSRSFITVWWKENPDKRLGLPVALNCPREQLKAEAEKAVRELAAELASVTIEEP